MKKLLYLALLLAVSYGYAQNTFPTQGNVGIGTPTPSDPLDVKGDATIQQKLKVKQDLVVDGKTKIKDTLIVEGLGKFKGDVKTLGDFKVEGDFKIKSLENSLMNDNRLVFVKPNGKIITNDNIISNSNYLLDLNGNLRVNGSFTASNYSFSDSVKIGANSIWLGGVNQNTGTNNHIYSTNGPLILQSNGNNQNTIINDNNGKVGIGTALPISKLHLKDRSCGDCGIPPSETVYLTMEDETYTQNQVPNQTFKTTWQIGLSAGNTPNTDKFFIYKFGNSNRPFTISGEGKVGINTGTFLPGINYDTPSALMLDVKGHARFYSLANNPNDYVRIGYNGANSIIDHFGQGGLLINYYSNKDVAFGGSNGGTSNVFVSGNLDVKGQFNICNTVKATEVVVETGWCDYVFEESYKRMSLEEKEAYLKENKHLPLIATQKDIEANGLQIGTTMKGFAYNIENLSLDQIELYKMVIALQEEVKQLKEELAKTK